MRARSRSCTGTKTCACIAAGTEPEKRTHTMSHRLHVWFGVVHNGAARHEIMHGKLGAQHLHFTPQSTALRRRLSGPAVLIHNGPACHTLHARSETQRRRRFRSVRCLRPHASDEGSSAIATERILQHVGQLRLAEGHVLAFLIRERSHTLLKERQRFVDMPGFHKLHVLRITALGPLRTRQINKM